MIFFAIATVLLVVLFFTLIIRSERRTQEQKLQLQVQMQAHDLQVKQDREQRVAQWRAEHDRKCLEVASAVLNERLIILDVETQYLSSEVAGGWDAVSEFLVSVAVTWDKVNGFRIWYEKDVEDLLAELKTFAQILTFNGDRFDFKVLGHYGPITGLKKKSVDLLAFIKRHTRKRVSLDSLAKECLRVKKSMTGIEAVNLWRSGDPAKRQLVVDYCKKDVEILRDLYVELHAFGLRFPGHNDRTVRIFADGSHDSI